MNYKKAIKDLKEFNSQLKGQYSDEQNRNYCLQCKIDKLEKEKQELKKKLEECSAVADTNSELVDSIDEHYKEQQKEFIEWLEDYIDILKIESDSVEGLGSCEYYTLLALEEVLSKYKEIVGSDK